MNLLQRYSFSKSWWSPEKCQLSELHHEIFYLLSIFGAAPLFLCLFCFCRRSSSSSRSDFSLNTVGGADQPDAPPVMRAAAADAFWAEFWFFRNNFRTSHNFNKTYRLDFYRVKCSTNLVFVLLSKSDSFLRFQRNKTYIQYK